MKKYRILNTPCFQVEKIENIKLYIKELLENTKGGYSVAINAEKIVMYSKDPEIKSIIDHSILPIPDGSGAVLGFKILYGVKTIKLNLPNTIFELADEKKYTVFILGSSEDTNIHAVKRLKEKFPNMQLVGRKNGYFKNEEDIIELLRSTSPQIVMVALGSPKQEKFAAIMNKTFPNVLFIGCGGALDILAGKITRAPSFFQDNYLEWFYRLVREPKRIKRQRILPVYLFKLLSEALKRKL